MRKIIISLMLFCLFASASLASHTAIIGGWRNGLAFGLAAYNRFADNAFWRAEVEASTGEDLSFYGINPFIFSVGGAWKVGQTGYCPMYLGLGLTGESGDNTIGGGSLSLIFNNIYNQGPLSMELGIDYLNSKARLQLQFGYRIYDS
jgi:hypothetical protein